MLASLVPVITPDRSVGEAYGLLCARLERAGAPIGVNDLWIAAHARRLGVTLVSHNTRVFSRVPDLRLETRVDR